MTGDPRLEPLVGGWRTEADIPTLGVVRGMTTFAWELGGAMLVQRSWSEHPKMPDALSVIARDERRGEGAYLQHYFDDRGVVRLYRMTFDGTTWTLHRGEPDFSELPFHQRSTGVLDGDTIRLRIERSPDGETWDLDFEVLYTRADKV